MSTEMEVDASARTAHRGEDKRRDATMKTLSVLREKNAFLIALDSYAPTVPEAVSRYYMSKSGVDAIDPRMTKLVSLAADFFLSKTVHEAKQMSLLKQSGAAKTNKRKKDDAGSEDLITVEDLERALDESGVHLRKR